MTQATSLGDAPKKEEDSATPDSSDVTSSPPTLPLTQHAHETDSDSMEEEPFSLNLTCPVCHHQGVLPALWTDKDMSSFLYLRCPRCRELELFPLVSSKDLPHLHNGVFYWDQEFIHNLQKDWFDWWEHKQKYLPKRPKRPKKWSSHLWVGLFVFLSVFFLLDWYHLGGAFPHSFLSRQAVVEVYAEKLSEVECLPDNIRNTLKEVEIIYTTEGPFNHGKIQYGEYGRYWGDYRIKIHRSNFWFFGLPKKSQLIETLLHEAQHAVRPYLGHQPPFYQLVRKDTNCALREL